MRLADSIYEGNLIIWNYTYKTSMVLKNESQLNEAIKRIQSTIPNTSLLLFRGESEKYTEMRSGKARPKAYDIPELENGWNTIVGRLVKDKNRSTEYKQAILQHYGYPTFYLDLTNNPLVAAWFATNKYTKLEPIKWIGEIGLRLHDRTTYNKINDGIGYLHILEIPNYKTLIDDNLLFDITNENFFIRPQKQFAFLMLDKDSRICDPNAFVIRTFEIDRSEFCSSFDIIDLFPLPDKDLGYNSLLDVPFVKNSFCYVPPDEPVIDMPDYMTLDYLNSHIKRIIDIPFYVKEINNLFGIKPKTKDLVLYEPILFRNWKQFATLNLADFFSIHSDVLLSDATKISLSPTSLSKMQNSELEIDLVWPEVNSDNILFVKTEYQHDVGGREAPPYLGVWLYRQFDQILMSYLSIENDGINGDIHVEPGDVYTFRNNVLVLEKTGDNTGRNIVELFLKIHGLIKNNDIALLPNPFKVPNWHILL